MELLKTSPEGLSDEEARARLEEYGYNVISEAKRVTALRIFIAQFKNVLIVLLIFASLLSLAIGELIDAAMIVAIVVLSALLGFYQEYKAERTLEALKELSAPKAKVLRDGRVVEINASEVVPGDILVVEAGDRIAADARVIESVSLTVDEAVLTGESEPVEKTAEVVEVGTLPEMKNIIFAGTICVFGRGKAVVFATGNQTEFGKIAEMLKGVEEEETPLQRNLRNVAKVLAYAAVLVCVLVIALGLLRGYKAVEMAIWGISLAVAAVPEALPAVVTICLSAGVWKMAKRNVIVRKLHAVETLSSVSVICTDKTGTLTEGKMRAVEVFFDGRTHPISPNTKSKTFEMLMLAISLCNNNASPTEKALLEAARTVVKAEYRRISEIPFSSERKMMTTINDVDGRRLAFTKGAPEVVLNICSRIMVDGKVVELDESRREEIRKAVESMASLALRVIAAAYGEEAEKNMIFLGLVGLIDPPRPEVKEAIENASRAGIRTVVVTGDNPITAKAIAEKLGISGRVLTGEVLSRMSDEELAEIVEDIAIYARVSPGHKLKIVNAWKQRGYVVAMTGDGVNDAPALKAADVGIAMGSGTEVAKEASDIVLVDNNYASIIAAVEEGRGIYLNIKKFLTSILSSNAPEVGIMLIALALAMPIPLLPVQILWINLITDGIPAIALSIDPKPSDLMRRKPRRIGESIFTPEVKALILGVTVFITAVTLGVFRSFEDVLKAQTVAFTLLVFLELFNTLNARALDRSLLEVGLLKNKVLAASIPLLILLQFAVVQVESLRTAFHTTALSVHEWAILLLISATIVPAVEAGRIVAKFIKLSPGS